MIFKYLKILTFQYFIIGCLFLGLLLLALSNRTIAYDADTVHPALTREIIDFYELSGGKKLTDEQKLWVIQGSVEEDLAPRWLNHFYDPIYERGLTTEAVGINGYLAKNWVQYSSYQTINPANIGNLWSGNGPVISGSWWGDFSYEAAIKDYSRDKEKEAYLALGHILHLIEDITVPEHTRNDPHPGEPRPSYYENWTKDNSSGLTQDLGKRIYNKGYKPVIFANLESYFNNLATYTNTHFFSPRTINSKDYQKPKIVFEDGTFAYGSDENGELFDLAVSTVDKSLVKNYSLNNSQILQEYWLRLSRQAVLNGAGVVQLFLTEAEKAKEVELAKQKIDAQQIAQKSSFISQIYSFFLSSEAPANEPALVINKESVKPLPKIIEQETVEPVAVQNPEPAQLKQTPDVATPNPAPAPAPAPTSAPTLTQTPAPAPTPAPQTSAPIVYNGGGSTSSSPAASSAPEVPVAPTFNPGDLVINEIMYDLEGSDTLNGKSREWVELYNKSGREIILTGGNGGWRFSDGEKHLLNEPAARGSMAIPVGGYTILTGDSATFLVDHPGFSGTVIDTAMSLKNSTSTIKIIAPSGMVIDEVTYYSSWGANGNGRTLERKSAGGSSNDVVNWAQSAVLGGTPGAVNNWLTLGNSTIILSVATSTIVTATSTLVIATSTLTAATSTLSIATSTLATVATSTITTLKGTDVAATTTISGNVNWTLAGSPYRLFFDGQRRPTVAAGAVLTIEPGVKIVPQGGGYTALEIQGTLNAIATSGAPVIFTSINDAKSSASTTPQKGEWLNVIFNRGSQVNLDYVEFRYGGQGLERPVKEMIKAVGAMININHSKFENSQSIALRLVDSNGVIENSVFSDNNCGISIDSLVSGDRTTDGGCAGTSGYFPAAATTTPKIKNNQFIRNRLVAVEARNGSTPILDGNLFTNNGYPIRIESSYPVVTNSQIANSTTSPNILNGIAIDGYTHFRKDYTLKKDLPYILGTNGPALSPYIDAGVTLTIEPGTILKTNNPNSALFVYGKLIASTTPDKPIVFTSLKDDSRGGDTNGDGLASAPQNNDWANIKFLTGSIGNFVNAIFSYGGFGYIAPSSPPPILLADFPAVSRHSTSTNQFYVPIVAGYSGAYLKPDHNGTFDKVIIHNFVWANPTNHNLKLTLFDKTNRWQQVISFALSNQQNINGEFIVSFPNNAAFIANHEYTFFVGDPEVAPNPMVYYDAAEGNTTGAGAFYETAAQSYSNPALSVDSGATVVVQ